MVLARHWKLVMIAALGITPLLSWAADTVPVILIHNAQFEPGELVIAPGVRTQLIVRNLDAIPAEFESYDLSREVVVAAHGEVSFYVGPVNPGRYEFFNDFNHKMKGTIIVKSAAEGH